MRHAKTRNIVTLMLVLTATFAGPTWAKKDNGNGGGGGGGKQPPAPYEVIVLPDCRWAFDISEPLDGLVTVAGEGTEGGFVSATYAVVDVQTREVVGGFLPEPTDNAPNDWASNARDANAAGVIVGSADVYDPNNPEERHSVAIRWLPQADGYTYQLLPLSAGDDRGGVQAINDLGEMVGGSGTYNTGQPVLWNAAGTQVISLNDLIAENSGWTLITANDINDSSQVVGTGSLNGVVRGYVLDLMSLEIIAVPLVAGADNNEAWRINNLGHVIGKANDDIVGGGPFPQGGWGYFWIGPGTTPLLLPSTTNEQAIARDINDFAEIAGDSHVSAAPPNDGDVWMNLWQPDAAGDFSVTDLNTMVPSKPVWYLSFGFGLNDDGWIAGVGRKFQKGRYSWHGVLVVPR